MRTIKKIFLCLAVFAFLAGCATKANEEDLQIKKAVARYNDAVTIGYKELNIEPLKDIAGKERVGKVEAFISAYLGSGLVMEAELHGIDFKEIKIEGDKAGVKTVEDWSYSWIDYKTRKTAVPRKDVRYTIFYALSKKDGRWIIEDAKDLSEKKTALDSQGS